MIPNPNTTGTANRDQVVSTLQYASPPLLLLIGDEECLSMELTRISHATASPLLSVSALLGTELLEQPVEERSRVVGRTFRALLRPYDRQLVLLDRIALLFLPELRLNPLQLLVDTSRSGPLIVAWSGAWDGQTLSYATSGHPEYRVYHNPSVLVEKVV